MEDVIIRKANISDLQIIQKLNAELCAKENQEYDSTINPDYPFSKTGEEYFKSRIESSSSLALVAEQKGEIIGYLAGSLLEAEDYRALGSIAESENTYVSESFRGRGIGSKLAEEFEKWSIQKGAERIRHIASAANSSAIDFYKQHGAKEVSIILEKEI